MVPTSSRRKAVIPAVVIVAVLIVGFMAVKSRGSEGNDKLDTTQTTIKNCPPVARMDAAAVKPGESIAIDVLANDTDADGDPLVFQILKTDGGTSTVDDGGTPTDSSDDRLLFTPDDPPAASALIEYQALDPQGGFSSSTVSVTINAEAALPAGAHSESATEGAGEGTCGGVGTTTTIPESIVTDTTALTTTTVTSLSTTGTTTRHMTTTTKKKGGKSTPTTVKKTTTTSGSAPTTPTTAPPTTTSQPKPPKPPNTTPTTHSNCVPPTSHDEEAEKAYVV